MKLSKTLFHLTALVTTAFIVTILSMIAMMLGNQNAPANLWFNTHGAIVMTLEVCSIGVLGLSAIIVDRRETLFDEARLRPRPGDAVQEAGPPKS